MESHALVSMDEAGNGYSDTFSEVRHNGGFEACQYNGMVYGHMRNLMEAIFLNRANKWANVFAKALYLHQRFKKIRLWKGKSLLSGKWKKHPQASARKNKYRVIDAVQEMPTFEGFILPYYASTMEGTEYPVNVEGMHTYRDGWEGFYNETVAKVAQAILEAKQIKEA